MIVQLSLFYPSILLYFCRLTKFILLCAFPISKDFLKIQQLHFYYTRSMN